MELAYAAATEFIDNGLRQNRNTAAVGNAFYEQVPLSAFAFNFRHEASMLTGIDNDIMQHEFITQKKKAFMLQAGKAHCF